jgi:hypothetical protein
MALCIGNGRGELNSKPNCAFIVLVLEKSGFCWRRLQSNVPCKLDRFASWTAPSFSKNISGEEA